ncbi:acyltransferase family protein [Paenibacillus sp. S150]|uniref:acyltransferase family protein n=1 Tax=Paenibacillus sp. S150 TaxID=2749826 RepID=UPI001C55E222|nr:acyltransferase family protein [Paenibacillus sp. S150]MBW4084538.1 acyltransferase family protein [Paenibacillus sp. S150]
MQASDASSATTAAELTSATTVKTPRLKVIDMVRGITILLVVVGHAGLTPVVLNDMFRDFRLPLFFIVSGYLFSASKYFDNFTSLLRTRFLTLVIPYLSAGLLSYLLWLILRTLETAHSPDIAWYEPLLAIAYGTYSGGLLLNIPIWFLTCLFVTQIIFCLSMRYLSKSPLPVQLAAMLALSLSGYALGTVLFLPWNIDVALVAQLFVFIGYQLKQHQLLGKIRVFNLGTLILMAIFLTAAYFNSYVDMNNREYGNLLLFYTAGIAGSLLAIKMTQLLSKSGFFAAILTYIGKESLAILIFHYGIFILLLNFVERYVYGSYLGWFPTTVIAVAGSLLLSMVIKHVPGLGFLLGGKGKKSAAHRTYVERAVSQSR